MKNQQANINQEILELAPVLASLPRVNPFAVPEGFFKDEISALKIAVSLQEAPAIPPVLADIGKSNPFSAPEGYFERFADNIWATIQSLETDTISAELLGLKKQSFSVPEGYFSTFPNRIQARLSGFEENSECFSVPAGYFESFSERLMERIKSEELPSILADLKTTGFSVPQDYFAESKETLLAIVKEEVVPKVIGGIPQNPFRTPEGYFQTLPARLREKVGIGGRVIEMDTPTPPAENQGGKVRQMWTRAASIAAILFVVFAISFLFRNDSGTPFDLQKEVASLSDDDLQFLLKTNYLDLEAEEIMNISPNINMFDVLEIDKDEVLEYLLDELDESLLNELL